MQIDIEKLSRKTPYPTFGWVFQNDSGSSDFKNDWRKTPVVQKETKVFSLNFKWILLVAVLIAGLTAFLGFENSSETQSFASQKPIVDSVYNMSLKQYIGTIGI
jgi:hypothetical protein